MERTIPQKVKPVPSCETETDTTLGQAKQALPETNRRVRKSAAMIGLALSMGAHGLLLSGPDDRAVAAEPVASEPTATTVPPTFDVATVSSDVEAVPPSSTSSLAKTSVIEHTVQEGQTLWQLAKLYGVDAVTVANANGIPVNAVLRVGQVLKIPTSAAVARVDQSDVVVSTSSPEYYGLVPAATPKSVLTESKAAASLSSQADAELKAQQDQAIDRLHQTRDTLKSSLTQLKAAKQAMVVPVTEESSVARPQAAKPQTEVESSAIEVKTDKSPAPVGTSVTYQVAPGDTLGAIAKAYGVSQAQLVEANQLANPNVIRVNQEIVIPQRVSGSAVSHASTTPALVAANLPTAATGLTLPVPRAPIARPSLVSASAALPKAANEASVPSVLPQAQELTAQGAQPQAVSLPLASQASKKRVATLPSRRSQVAVPSVGDVTVATAPFSVQKPTQSEEPGSKLRYDYVENLRLEIVKLREKYRTAGVHSAESTQATKVAAATLNIAPASKVGSTSEPINLEFNPSGYEESLRTQARTLRLQQRTSRKASEPLSGTSSAKTKPQAQVVATAPIGSQNYEPLLPSSLGQMVSPSLPPLGSVDSYLPGAAGQFKGYIWPAKGVLTSGYGWRWGRMHKGIDIAAPIGTPVVAAASGVVISAGWNAGGYGNLVEIQHPDGSVTLYAHNDRILVREGQQVEQGQQIAEMGSTGYSTGPHSHFEVHLPGQGAVNPIAYLPRSGA